ncbi:MAG: ATP-binding protein [Dehalococcoidia bacterium]|nr:MAG: ATP-binding protein [Dehalococcoidia bacterium]
MIMKLKASAVGVVKEGATFDVFKFESNESLPPGSYVTTPVNSNSFVLGRVINAFRTASGSMYEASALEQFFEEGRAISLSEPKEPARPGASVHVAGGEVIAQAVGFGENSRRAIYIGESGACSVLLRPEILIRHVFIGGTTGVGKSYTVGIILEELSRLGIPAVVIDSQDEYTNLAQDLSGVVVRPGRDYTVQLSSLTNEEAVALAASLRGTSGYELFNFSFLALKREVAEGRRAEFNLADLLRKMESDAPSLGLDGYQMRMAASRAESSIRRHDFLGVMGKKLDWAGLVKKGLTVNVDCSRLDLLQLQLVTGATLRELQKLRLDKKVPPYVLVLDEAHLLAPEEGESPCKQVIRENVRIGRHYGICVVMVTQNPLDIDKKTISQCNTRFIFALEPDQLSSLQGVKADITEDMFRRIPKMPRGTCLLSGTHETVKHAVTVKVRSDRKTRRRESEGFL